MKHLPSFVGVVLGLGLAGCLIHGQHVPGAIAGDVPLRISNQTGADLCYLLVQPFAQPTPSTENLLGDSFRQSPIKAGADHEIRLKPGAYRIGVATCDGQLAAGTQNGKVELAEPSIVAIGVRPPGPGPSGYRLAAVLPAIPAGTASSGGGGEVGGEAAEAPAESSEAPAEQTAAAPAKAACKPNGAEAGHYSECCSGRTTGRGTLHNGGRTVCCADDADCVSTP